MSQPTSNPQSRSSTEEKLLERQKSIERRVRELERAERERVRVMRKDEKRRERTRERKKFNHKESNCSVLKFTIEIDLWPRVYFEREGAIILRFLVGTKIFVPQGTVFWA